MAAPNGLTMTPDIEASIRAIDFVSQFRRNMNSFREIAGRMRMIPKAPGTTLKQLYAKIDLEDGNIGEGEDIPLSKATVKERAFKEIKIEKYAKAITLEDIIKYGYDSAVKTTDEEFMNALRNKVIADLYDNLHTGTLIVTGATGLVPALAKTKGAVLNKWREMHRDITDVVAWCNINDYYDWAGVQPTAPQVSRDIGLDYIKGWLGFGTVFLCSDSEIEPGTVITTPNNNLILCYINANHPEIERAGLVFTVDSAMPLLGINVTPNMENLTSKITAIMGTAFYAEYIDGIAQASFGSGTLSSLTLTSAAGTDSGTTAVTVSPSLTSGNSYKYKLAEAGNVPTVTPGQNVKTWKAWDGTSDIPAASGEVLILVEADANFKAVKSGTTAVTAND